MPLHNADANGVSKAGVQSVCGCAWASDTELSFWVRGSIRSKHEGLLSEYRDTFVSDGLAGSANSLTRLIADVGWSMNKSFFSDLKFKAVEDVFINLHPEFRW